MGSAASWHARQHVPARHADADQRLSRGVVTGGWQGAHVRAAQDPAHLPGAAPQGGSSRQGARHRRGCTHPATPERHGRQGQPGTTGLTLMAPRGTTSERGYGIEHQRIRAWWKPEVESGDVICWRCGRFIDAEEQWHLGHDDMDRTIYRGPEHMRCNVATQTRGRATAAQPVRKRKNSKRFNANNARSDKRCNPRHNGEDAANNAQSRAWIHNDNP